MGQVLQLAYAMLADQIPFPDGFAEEKPDHCVDDYREAMDAWRDRLCAHPKWVRNLGHLTEFVTRDRSPKAIATKKKRRQPMSQVELDRLNNAWRNDV